MLLAAIRRTAAGLGGTLPSIRLAGQGRRGDRRRTLVALIQLLGEVDHRSAGRVHLHNTLYSEDAAWAHRQITQAA